RHAQAVIPGAEPVVVVASGFDEFLMQEAIALTMFEHLEEIFFVRRFVAFTARAHAALVFHFIDKMVMIANIGNNIFEGQSLGIFLAPIIERRADRFGGIEAGHIMAAIAAQSGNCLAAYVPLELIVSDRSFQ